LNNYGTNLPAEKNINVAFLQWLTGFSLGGNNGSFSTYAMFETLAAILGQ
jgi:hypothetical protein